MIAADTSTWVAFLEGGAGQDALLLDKALEDRQVVVGHLEDDQGHGGAVLVTDAIRPVAARGDRLHPVVTEQEEGAVLAVVDLRYPDGASDASSIFIAVQRRSSVGEVIAGPRYAVSAVSIRFEKRAVELVAAALGEEDHGAWAGKLGR